MSEAIVTIRELSPEEKLKQEAYYREKRLHDEASALDHAERKGETRGIAKGKAERDAEIAEIMRKKGFTDEQIKLVLGENYV